MSNDDLFADRTPRFRGPTNPDAASSLDRDTAYALGSDDYDASPFDFDDPAEPEPAEPQNTSEVPTEVSPQPPASNAETTDSTPRQAAQDKQPVEGTVAPAPTSSGGRHVAPELPQSTPQRRGNLVAPVDEPDQWDADGDEWDDGADEWSDPIPPSPNAPRAFDDDDPVPPPRPARPAAPTVTVGVRLEDASSSPAAGTAPAVTRGPAAKGGRDTIVPPTRTTTADRSIRQAPTVATPERRSLSERLKSLFPGKSEAPSTDNLRLVRSSLIGSVNIVFVNVKGGVGKTMACAMTGKTFATERTDYILAVDASPEGGQLAQRDRQENYGTVRSLIDALDGVERYSHVRQFTSRGESGLEILGSNPDMVGQKTLQAEEYTEMMRELRNHYSIILTDCAQGITGDLMGAILDEADVVVMVSEGADGMQGATRTANEMAAAEGYWGGKYAHLVDDMVVLVTSASARTNVDVRKVEEFFNTMARKVVRLDYDQALEGGRGVELAEVSNQTRKTFMQLAAAIADSAAFREAGR